MLLNQKTTRPDLQKWAHHVDLMIRHDRREPSEIRRLIEWSQCDEFWQVNIRSTEKLRAQFDQLVDKSQSGYESRREKEHGTSAKGRFTADDFGKFEHDIRVVHS
jgi:hypothetical protein